MSGLNPFRTTDTLPTFPPELYQETRYFLLSSGYCENEQRLRNLFVDARIRPFLHQLPNTHSPDERARALINHLTRQTGQGGGNGLVLFIAVLMDVLPQQDALRHQAQTLHNKLSQINWADYNRLSDVPEDENGRLRQNFINNVHRTWIEGVLHNAVHHDIYLTLGMAYQPEAVSQLWQSRLLPDNEPIPEAMGIYELFVRNGRSLLILGAPASGKTITLLQLCEQLLKQAATMPHAPLPVVLNLSSWQGEDFEQWLIEAIFLQYGLARSVGQRWLKDNHIVLLLDGLDEVAKERRDACIEAINQLRGNYPLELVVCSRTDDYTVLEKRLQVTTAVYIDPLTPSQVQSYLTQFGERSASLRDSLQANEQLQELAESPLMLSLMVLTYENATPEQMPTVAEQRTRLFQRYVRRVFLQRPLPDECPYSEKQSLTWLTNLAYGMVQQQQTVFYLEKLQLTWLPTTFQKPYKIMLMMSLWLITIIIFLLIYLTNGELYSGLRLGILLGFLFGFIELLSIRQIELVDSLIITVPNPKETWIELKSRLVGGLMIGILFAFIIGLQEGVQNAIQIGLLMIISNLFLGFMRIKAIPGSPIGLQFIQKKPLHTFEEPNHGIKVAWKQALKGGIVRGLSIGFSFGLTFCLVVVLFNLTAINLTLLVISGFMAGFVIGLGLGIRNYGGVTIFKHYTLRWFLTRAKILPYPFFDKKLVAFLDRMAERMLLRRVGGGWIFIHRYLLEYFASLHSEYEPDSAN